MHAANVMKRRRINRRRQPVEVIRDERGRDVGHIVRARAKPQFPFLFTVVPHSTLELLAVDSRLRETDRKVLTLLMLELAGKGWQPLKQDVIAARIERTQSVVSRSLARLAVLSINGVAVIERRNRGGVTGAAEWRLNMHCAWRGNATNFYIQERERAKERAGLVSEHPDVDGVLPDREEP